MDLIIYVAIGVIVYILFKQQIRVGKVEKDLAQMVQTKAVDEAFNLVAKEKGSDKEI